MSTDPSLKDPSDSEPISAVLEVLPPDHPARSSNSTPPSAPTEIRVQFPRTTLTGRLQKQRVVVYRYRVRVIFRWPPSLELP